ENDIAVKELNESIENGKKKLLKKRTERIRPLLDDKIILSWNALMNTACSKAFAATANPTYRKLAIDNMNFLLKNFAADKANEFHHTWKNNTAKYSAFLDDYAFLIQALIQLQEITADTAWLKKARVITESVIENFSEAETGYFFYTSSGQTDVIVRKKEIHDGAVPSGNSVMAYNLHHLSILFDKKEWEQRSISIFSSLGKAILRYPTSFANWACLLQEIIMGTDEIAIIGNDFSGIHTELLGQYFPHRVLMASEKADPEFPLLAEKPVIDTPAIFLCRNYTCQHPVFSAKDLISLINKPQTG
ncbi:MAG: thioredoxin domain-containing protein, partial [Bacteroidota bacterium]